MACAAMAPDCLCGTHSYHDDATIELSHGFRTAYVRCESHSLSGLLTVYPLTEAGGSAWEADYQEPEPRV